MISRTLAAFGAMLLAGFSWASAEHLEQGDREVQFRFSYNHLDLDAGGSFETTEALGLFGYMLTDHHEIGAGVAYASFDSADVVEYGVAYNYNFHSGESLNPYVGIFLLGFGGDQSDAFDFGYAAELGVKLYPWSHGGMLFGVTYRQLEGAGRASDATNVIAFGGLTLKL